MAMACGPWSTVRQFYTAEVFTPPSPPPAPYSIGKGLTEYCAPNATVQVFGVPLGTPQGEISAATWDCPPSILSPTTIFDVSAIGPGHEVVVALVNLSNVNTSPTFSWNWYRERDNQLLFSLSWTAPPLQQGYYFPWLFSYSYIGFLYPGALNQEGLPEIMVNEDGYYYVDASDTTGNSARIRFLVTDTSATGGDTGGIPLIARKLPPVGGGVGGF